MQHSAGNTGRHVAVRRPTPDFWPGAEMLAPNDRSRIFDDPYLDDEGDDRSDERRVDDVYSSDTFVSDGYADDGYAYADDRDLTTDLRPREGRLADDRLDNHRQHDIEDDYEYEDVLDELDDEYEFDEYTMQVRVHRVDVVARVMWQAAAVWGVVYFLVATSGLWS